MGQKLEGGEGQDRTPHYWAAIGDYTKGIGLQGCAWYLIADIYAFNRTDHVKMPVKPYVIKSKAPPPQPKDQENDSGDNGDLIPWNWLYDPKHGLGKPGTPFSRLARTWRARVLRDGRKERERKAKLFNDYFQARKR